MLWPQEELTVARRILAAAPTLRDAATQLRERFAPLRAAVVDAAEMREETPALRAGRRALYFAASNGYCWTLTQEPEGAQLLVLTEE